jgi:hypothetical protein
MKNSDSSMQSQQPRVVFHLNLVGKVALMIGALACFGLVLVLLFITDKSGASYGEIIRSNNFTRQSLGPAMLVAGLILVAFSAVITWLVSLYSSFRIAGPLFRFARNLEAMIESGPSAPVPIRSKDRLQVEGQQLARSTARLQAHYGAIRDVADRAVALLDSNDNGAREMLPVEIAKLKEFDRHVLL